MPGCVRRLLLRGREGEEREMNDIAAFKQQLPAVFKPEEARLNDTKHDAVIAVLAQLGDWDRVRDAINWKLEHLEQLVGWWTGNVRDKGKRSNVTDPLHFVEEAERRTGFTKMQISRIKGRLQKFDDYVASVEDATRRKVLMPPTVPHERKGNDDVE